MYKKYNSEANTLSTILERIVPFLVISATFIWLWQ
jgi:hypothetical protein